MAWSAQTVENSHYFFNVYYTWYKSLVPLEFARGRYYCCMTRYDWAEVKIGFVKIESVSRKKNRTDGPILNYPQCLFENAFPQIERYLVLNNMQFCTNVLSF